jgi:hypothetical protein
MVLGWCCGRPEILHPLTTADIRMNATDKTPNQTSQPAGCISCLGQPCRQLSLGGVSVDAFRVVHTSRLGVDAADCPCVVRSPEEFADLLTAASFDTVADCMNDAVGDLSASEQLRFDHRQYVNQFDDSAGRIDYLKLLFEHGVITAVRVAQANPAAPARQ